MRAYERETGEFQGPEHLKLGYAERGLEEMSGGGIKNLEIARIEDNAGRVAIAPFNPHCAGIGESGHRANPYPFVPANAGTQDKIVTSAVTLDSRLRGNERGNDLHSANIN
jgi:hypothetical protein